MKCHICESVATEKHHISYYPEETIAVCAHHGDEIHSCSSQYQDLIKFHPGDASFFYSQKKRIDKFLTSLSKAQRFGRRR